MLNVYKLEQQIETQMKARNVPGLAIAIVRDQEVIYARGFGVTSLEDGGLPVTPQTLFRIGSTNKPMTGTAIMRLVEDGKLDLDRQVLSPKSVIQMHTPQADLYTVWDRGYGLTFDMRSYKGLRLVGHDGDVNTFACKFVMAPGVKVAIMILVNRFEIELDKLAHHVLDQLLDLPAGAPQPRTIEPDRTLWPLYAGTYLGPFGLATISVEDDQLILNFNGEKLPLQASRKDLYSYQKPESEKITSVGFLPEETGPTQYILIDSFYCKRIDRETLSPPNPTVWPTYVGTYSDFDTLTVQIRDGQLHLYSQEDGVELPCKPLDRTRFTCDAGLVEFRIAEDGAVDSLVLREAFTFKRVEAGG